MQKLKWSQNYVIYLPEFDAEHRALFESVEALSRAVRGEMPADQIPALAEALTKRLAQHLSHEERVMRAASYPSFEWHKRQHNTARSRTRAFASAIRNGNLGASGELLDFLTGWADAHIRVTDRMMAAYIQNYQWSHAGRRAS